MQSPYPEPAGPRDRWILAHRGPRNAVDPRRPYGFLLERERAESGEVVSMATLFLTNRECPWRCLMCDLWKNTLEEAVPLGAIPAQIEYALTQLANAPNNEPWPPQQIKLYNSGSFFDPRAIPPEDFPAIAERVAPFERVIVECHPSLIGPSALRFRDLLSGKLEVAMGLETAHPAVLDKLNKRMSLDLFRRAAEFLVEHGLALRVFILVQPPFIDPSEAVEWAERSMDFAFSCGAGVVSLIPTRRGNGALDALAALGHFAPPRLATLEAAVARGIGLTRGHVFADLWDLEAFSNCAACFPARRARLERMNLTQHTEASVPCPACATT